MFTGPQRAKHRNTLLHFHPMGTDRCGMAKTSTSSSGCDAQRAFGNDWSIDDTIRADEHPLPADQTAFHEDTRFDTHVAYALHTALNAGTGTDMQFASCDDVSG